MLIEHAEGMILTLWGLFSTPFINGKYQLTKGTTINKINRKFECGAGGCGASVGNTTQIMM